MNHKMLVNGIANGGFNIDDLSDAKSLIQTIATSTKPLQRSLKDRLMAAQLLPYPEWADANPDKFRAAVVEELNRIIGGAALYQEAHFAGIKLSQSTRKLLRRPAEGPALVKLNKFLILDMFPQLLMRRPGRGKNTVQQPAVVTTLKDGTPAVMVTLVEPRLLLGKLRDGRQKFERQTRGLANDLCIEINNVLFGKELARQLSAEEIKLAKHLFWDLLEPNHSEWLQQLDELVEFCVRNGFRVRSHSIPDLNTAARIFWREYLSKRTKETRMNYRNFFGFLLPAFGTLRPFMVTDTTLRKFAYGEDKVKFLRTSYKEGQNAEEAEARLWDTLMDSESVRPWDYYMIFRFLTCARKFWNWMAESVDPATQAVRDWCEPSALKTPKPVRTEIQPAVAEGEDAEVINNPALTPEQVQAVIDVAWVAYGGKFAPFYVHGFWGGTRVKETRKTNIKALAAAGDVLSVPPSVDKTKRGREVAVYPNMLLMVEALKSAGRYSNAGLDANQDARAVIQILAGFTSGSQRRLNLAEAQRRRLEAQGYQLPKYAWGIPFPANSIRRTALSMHYKLFQNESTTTFWGGNTPGIFKEYYKRLVTPEQAIRFWQMLPTWLTAKKKIPVELPKDHKLDTKMTVQLEQCVVAAREAMAAFSADAEAAAANLVHQHLEKRRAKARERAALYRKQKAAPAPPTDTIVPLPPVQPDNPPAAKAA